MGSPDSGTTAIAERQQLGAVVLGNRLSTSVRAVALGAVAVGACALGAAAIGALAIGRLAVGALRLRRGRAGVLDVEVLRIGRLHVRELIVDSRTV